MILIDFKKENLIKSPLNYTGGKFKLLPQILPLLPNNINKFIDLFTGGCNVGVNVKANQIICNDIQVEVIELLEYLKEHSSGIVINQIEHIILKYGLSKTSEYGYEYYDSNSNDGVGKYNKERYIRLRNDYNDGNKSPDMFFTMIAFAFNNMIRFNDKGEFNVAVNKRDFNDSLRTKLIKFIEHLKTLDIKFSNNDFRKLKIDNLSENDFVYADPPYLITYADYSIQALWNEDKENRLLSILDDLDSKNIKFALSNVLIHNGKENEILKNWSKQYNIHKLDYNYHNCNADKKIKKKDTIEVLITNYIH